MPKKPSPPRPDDVRAGVTALRELLVSSVTLTTDRLQDAVEDAVRRGRMTRRDAEELAGTLIAAGRQQTEAVLADLDRLLGRRLRSEAPPRRRPAFPIADYEQLTAAEINRRVKDLTPAQLRKVRDRERHGAARKSVLAAIERRLR